MGFLVRWYAGRDSKRALKKHAGGMFLARGRVPLRFQTHPIRDVDEIGAISV